MFGFSASTCIINIKLLLLLFLTYQSTEGKMSEIALVNVIAGEILNKVISLCTEQISLAWVFEDELTQLCDSLTMTQAVLADAERRQGKEEFVRLWLQRLKDVAYDDDDVLDELAYEILKQKVEIRNQMKRKVRFFFTRSNPIVFFHFSVS